MVYLVNTFITDFLRQVFDFLPSFFGGIGVLIFGILTSTFLKKIFVSVLNFLKLANVLEKMRLMRKSEVIIWQEVLAEIMRWTVVILFLIPTLEIWNLSRASIVINQFLFYLPNVIVAVIIGFVGLIASNLGSDLVRHSIKTIGATSANTLSVFTKWLITFFTVLVVLNQLGVAQDLVRILFTGIIVMIALAGGLAFGLGGKDIARDMLEEMRKKFR